MAYRRYPLERIQRNPSVSFWFFMAILHPLLPHTNSKKKDIGKYNTLLMDFPAPNSGYPATIHPVQKASK